MCSLIKVEGALGGAFESVVGNFDIPLIAEVGFDGDMAAVGVADAVGVGLDVFEEGFRRIWPDLACFELADDEFAGFFAGFTNEDMGTVVGGVIIPAMVCGDGGIGSHDVDDGEVVSLAQFPVVGVVGGSDFEEACGELCFGVAGIGIREHDIGIFDDGNDTTHEWQLNKETFERFGAMICWVDRDSGVAEVGFGARGSDGDPCGFVGGMGSGAGVASGGQFIPGDGSGVKGIIGVGGFVDEWVAEVVEVALDFNIFDFII